MKLAIVSDTHGDLGFQQFVKDVDADFVLHCGDLSLYSEFDKLVLFVKGNHEDWDVLEAMKKGVVEFKNLRYIKNGEVLALKKEDEIVKILGFGGNYSPKYYGASKLEGDRRRHFTDKEFKEACIHKKIDILLTHESPLGLVMNKRGNDYGQPLITELVEKTRPKYAFSGHHHVFNERIVDSTRCVAVPRFGDGMILLDTKNWGIMANFGEN